MARIRTIKPEFFTSEDVCALSPLARLLFIGTWLEADREGRLSWKPHTLKKRYLPDDQCDIEAVARELTTRGVVVPYGDGLAYIPKFLDHQVVNPREAKSKLPEPTKEAVEHACKHASLRVPHAPSLPSVPFPSLPSPPPSIPVRSGNLIMGPAEYAKRLEFCAFVGSRLEVPKTLHRELVGLLGGAAPDVTLMAWYEALNAEIEMSGEAIKPSVYKWLKVKYEAWQSGNGEKSFDQQLDEWARS